MHNCRCHKERESKRLSFLHLGSARRRRNGNPSRGGQDSHSGKGRSKKTEKPKTGKEARKPDTGTGRELENQAQKTGKAPKAGRRNREGTRKRGHATKSAPKKGDARQSLLRKQKSPLSEQSPTGVNT